MFPLDGLCNAYEIRRVKVDAALRERTEKGLPNPPVNSKDDFAWIRRLAEERSLLGKAISSHYLNNPNLLTKDEWSTLKEIMHHHA